MKKKVLVVGLGNTGQYAVRAIKESADMECAGIIRRQPDGNLFEGVPQYYSIAELPAKPDCAVLCVPSKHMPEVAQFYLENGVNTVDSFDIHGQIAQSVKMLDSIAKQAGRAAVIGAGWDPGTNSVMRAMLRAMEPNGQVFTSFGPGMSMGHSVAARGIKGVADAVSITMPLGMGKHKRHVYVKAKPGVTKEEIYKNMKADSYFAKDQLIVELVPDTAPYKNPSHGGMVEVEYGGTRAKFAMAVNNPRTTAQIMIACARAAMRMTPGAYSVIDLPPAAMLEGDRFENIKKLV